jgi:uncharacterized membrane protein YciS (DUF1049 family)
LTHIKQLGIMNKIYYFIHYSILIQYFVIFFVAFMISIFLYLKCKTKDENLFKEIKIKKDENEISKKKKKEGK